MDSVEVDMNYEFFFLRNVSLENPTVLRVMAPSYHEAICHSGSALRMHFFGG